MASTLPSSPRSLALSCFAALAWLAGCSSVQLVLLEPTRGNEALVVGSGVEVSANSRQRPPSVPGNFTPVRLSVHNTGNTPLYVGLDDIDLPGPERALPAVPPGSGPRAGRSESVLLEPRVSLRSSPRGAPTAVVEIPYAVRS